MSKFNLLSAAIVVAVAAAAPAQAYNVNSAAAPASAAATPATVATVDIANNNTAVAATGINVSLGASDLIIGRTVGFTVKFALGNGAKLNTAVVAPAVGAAVTGWSIHVAAGGAVGDDYVILKFDPAAVPTGVASGELFTAAGMTLHLKGVSALASAGSSVVTTVTFADPGTATEIMGPSKSAVILKSADPLKYSVTGGDLTKKIDVGSGNGSSKTTFSINGAINSTANPANASQAFLVGVPTVGVQAGVLNAAGANFTWVAADDMVELTLSGTSFAAFKTATPANGASVYLVKAGGICQAAPTAADVLVTGVVGNSSVAWTGSKAVTAGDLAASHGVCFVAPTVASKVVIDATKVQTSVVVTRDATGNDSAAAADALPLVYNGPVIDVDAFNPASNASQLSYLRITNASGLAGKATIDRVCDDGTTKGSTSLTIAGGATVALTAEQLENGGNGIATGFGACPAGQKSRLTVSGEFNGMKVQNFLRNTSTIINTNVNNSN